MRGKRGRITVEAGIKGVVSENGDISLKNLVPFTTTIRGMKGIVFVGKEDVKGSLPPRIGALGLYLGVKVTAEGIYVSLSSVGGIRKTIDRLQTVLLVSGETFRWYSLDYVIVCLNVNGNGRTKTFRGS